MSENLPSFSVVTPLYNKAQFIGLTLDSALNQDLAPLEMIVVDDGSSDNGPEIVRGRSDPRIRLVQQANGGPGVARNRGAEDAHGTWIAFLDADDLWLPHHLTSLAKVIQSCPDADLVATGWRRATRRQATQMVGEEQTDIPPQSLDYFRDGWRGQHLWTSATAVRRSVFIASGGFGRLWPGEDVELWARLALDHPVAFTPFVSAVYVQETGGAMDSGASDRDYDKSPTEQPLIITLDRARRDPRYAAIRRELSIFRNETLIQWARPALYNGHTQLARAYLRAVEPGYGWRLLPYRLLAAMPKFVLATARRAFRYFMR